MRWVSHERGRNVKRDKDAEPGNRGRADHRDRDEPLFQRQPGDARRAVGRTSTTPIPAQYTARIDGDAHRRCATGVRRALLVQEEIASQTSSLLA
jgi:hypothetical protein